MTRRYGNKAPTRRSNAVAAESVLVMRDDLAGLNEESWARSYGLKPAEALRLLQRERARRRAQGRVA